MIIYEVNMEISSDITNNFLPWLISHANRMIEFDGFKKYNIYNNMDYEKSFTIHYYIKSIHFLEKYLSNCSEEMRNLGKNKFGNKMNITRRILSIIE